MWCTMDGRYDEALAFARAQKALYHADGSAVGEQLAAGNVAAMLVAVGQPEAALAEVEAAHEALVALGADALAGHVIGSRMLVLTILGRHDEARERGRAAYARLQREGDTLWLLEPLALGAAQEGRLADAARIAGFVDARLAAAGDVRRAPARARRAQIDALLADRLADDARRTLLAEGARLREDEAFALAFGAPA